MGGENRWRTDNGTHDARSEQVKPLGAEKQCGTGECGEHVRREHRRGWQVRRVVVADRQRDMPGELSAEKCAENSDIRMAFSCTFEAEPPISRLVTANLHEYATIGPRRHADGDANEQQQRDLRRPNSPANPAMRGNRQRPGERTTPNAPKTCGLPHRADQVPGS
ncbi:hypothetical protein GCM10011591_28810 [Nocardia camponoti]|uniref:Uncharacterized protein n=1 Tax=Nocardia camponoti TaxID=1616106 RepID=A0A917QKJ8_9NOCA|nr:hypothetical protein GCM10011591_28810 [Nocardia camponoti]